MAQIACHLHKTVTRIVTLDYLLHLPGGYEQGGPWPLIIFLHGAGERGSDLSLLNKNPLPAMLAADETEFPFVVVSPQCPTENWWSMMVDELLALLDDVEARYNVDRNRVYLTGLSMGGFGAWSLASAHPERFAAIAPICGGYHGPSWFVRALKQVPVWAFHGAKDPVVPVEQTLRLVEELRQVDGDVRVTVYPELEHDSWTATYHDPELFEWFLSHARNDSD
jgi:predicted peptidase